MTPPAAADEAGRELGIRRCLRSRRRMYRRDDQARGPAAEGLLCSQAGIPPKAASQKFLECLQEGLNVDPILYAPFTYDAANMLIDAMKKANSADPAKYLPELAKLSFTGATGQIEFDDKGDRKTPRWTIFTMKGGKIEPIAIIKGGASMRWTST